MCTHTYKNRRLINLLNSICFEIRIVCVCFRFNENPFLVLIFAFLRIITVIYTVEYIYIKNICIMFFQFLFSLFLNCVFSGNLPLCFFFFFFPLLLPKKYFSVFLCTFGWNTISSQKGHLAVDIFFFFFWRMVGSSVKEKNFEYSNFNYNDLSCIKSISFRPPRICIPPPPFFKYISLEK